MSADPGTLPAVPYGVRALRAAERLGEALAARRVVTRVHDGHGLALLAIQDGPVVWCDGERFWWWAGWDERQRHARYDVQRVGDPGRVADHLVRRLSHLWARRPYSAPGGGGEE